MIEGFVVNTYDALNYDIDFPSIDKNNKIFYNIISNDYAYKTIQNNELSETIHSQSYRCRLNGIEINSKTYNRKQIKQYSYEVKKMIDRYDGQIRLTIKGIDIFNKLLIDIYISPQQYSLCNWLLEKSSHDKATPFVKYNSFKYKNNFNGCIKNN